MALAGLLVVPLLLNNPRASFLIWVTAFVIAENTADWSISIFAKLYNKTPVLYFSPIFLLLLLTALGVLLDVKRPNVEARLPRPFGPALALVLLAILFGYANARPRSRDQAIRLPWVGRGLRSAAAAAADRGQPRPRTRRTFVGCSRSSPR